MMRYTFKRIPRLQMRVLYLWPMEKSPPVNLKHSLGDLISSGAVHRHLENIEIDQGSCLKTLEYINRFGLSSLRDNDEGYSIFCHAAPLTQRVHGKIWG